MHVCSPYNKESEESRLYFPLLLLFCFLCLTHQMADDFACGGFFSFLFLPVTQGNAKSYSPPFLNAMAGLMGVPRVRQALIALRPVDRERFGGYARYCLKFQRDDLTPEVMYDVH